eukprot:scaffold800_cov111-Isochrysis_galbana.AAC.9
MRAPAAGHALLLMPAVAALGMLAALYALPGAMRRRALAAAFRSETPQCGSQDGSEPLWRRHHLGGTSLSSAQTWQAHKYRAKQHVLRVYLTGANSPFAPWAMPVLPHELRALVSEASYYAFCETFRETSRSGRGGGTEPGGGEGSGAGVEVRRFLARGERRWRRACR